jgi:long-chain fatty acid transport protein
MIRRIALIAVATLGLGLLNGSSAWAQSFGIEMHNTLMPASGAMGGTSIARPQDFLSSINGNPASLTQYSGTQFTFAGAWTEPTFDMNQTAALPLVNVTPYSAKSTAPGAPMGNIGVMQDLSPLGLPGRMGIAFISGAGGAADFRQVPASNGTNTALQVFELNNTVAIDITDRLSFGAGASLGIANFDGPFVGISGMTPAYALRGVTGLNYAVTDFSNFGVYYQSKQAFNFDNAVQFAAGPVTVSQDIKMDLPRNVGLGVSNHRLMDGRLLLAADFLYKNWDDAQLFKSIYRDQWAFQFGTQYTTGRVRWRAGYVFAQNPLDSSPVSNVGGVVLPDGIPAVRYAQGLLAVANPHRISAGVGIRDVMLPGLDLDVMAGGMFRNSEQLGPDTNVSVASYWIAGGMTWRFK